MVLGFDGACADDSFLLVAWIDRVPLVLGMGGKPSKGTAADKRLKENRPKPATGK